MAQQLTGECHFGLHEHCLGSSLYEGKTGWLMSLPCTCECHSKKSENKRKEERSEREEKDL